MKFMNTETGRIAKEEVWERWFWIYGKQHHIYGKDGWSIVDAWIFDMMRNGILVAVEEE